jgi:hypothetical protein
MNENTYTPKQTAIWLIDNTALTFKQIGEFCGLHAAEVEAIADGTVAGGMVGENPVYNGELTKEEIARCEADSEAPLNAVKNNRPKPKSRAKGPRYTPLSKRGDKPDAILYLLKHHPEMTDANIVKLIGTTKNTINSIRDKAHANYAEMKPRHPADLGLCTYIEYEEAVEKARVAGEKAGTYKRPVKEEEVPQAEQTAEEQAAASTFDFSNFLGTGSN